MVAKAVASTVLGHPVVERLATLVSGRHLRVLAYHDVPGPAVFRDHLEHLASHYRVVAGAEVAASVERTSPLPARAVWITFDDGYPRVFEIARPLLAEFGLLATAFVCPGVIDTRQPFWWEIVRLAVYHRLTEELDGRLNRGADLEGELKRVDDRTRRQIVEQLEHRLHAASIRVESRQASSEQLREWSAAGFEIGNHTWDHPCLDRADARQQREQISRAHDWLSSSLGRAPDTFAYPNGNWAADAEAELRRLGYRTAVGFDHHICCSRRPNGLRISRLRVDADAPLGRLRSVLSGTHSGLLSMRQMIRGRAADPRRLPR